MARSGTDSRRRARLGRISLLGDAGRGVVTGANTACGPKLWRANLPILDQLSVECARVPAVKSVDVHQHLWPEAVLEVLERRSEAPRARRHRGVWQVELSGEPAFQVDPREHDPERRARDLGVDHALVALSAPAGIEELPARGA